MIDAIEKLDAVNKEKAYKLYYDNYEAFNKAWGSSYNHQAWEGGYADHIEEVMMIAENLYESLSKIRPLPFKLQDAYLVLFLHDLEKPWRTELRQELEENGKAWSLHHNKNAKREFRSQLIEKYGIELTEEQQNAMLYVEGENDDYSSKRRVMNELAAFCHLCDVTSARIWHDKP